MSGKNIPAYNCVKIVFWFSAESPTMAEKSLKQKPIKARVRASINLATPNKVLTIVSVIAIIRGVSEYTPGLIS